MITDSQCDELLEIWVEEFSRRQRGEVDSLRTPSWALSGVKSACCDATPTVVSTRKGRSEVCSICRKPCIWKTWIEPRGASSRGDGITTMALHETRVVNRDAEDASRARGVSRMIAVAGLFEPVPRGFMRERWHRVLLAWFALVRFGVTRGVGVASSRGAGKFTRFALYQYAGQGREVVQRRAQHDPWRVRAALGREVA